MADSPPPYSWSGPSQGSTSYAGHIRRVVPTEAQPMAFSSTEDYTHRHNAYMSTVTLPHESSEVDNMDISGRRLTMLHFCRPDSSSSTSTAPVSYPVPGELRPDTLTMVQGFQDCGIFHLPKESIGDEADHLQQRLRDALSARLHGLHEANCTEDSGSEHVDSVGLVDSKQKDVDLDNRDAPVFHVYKIHMFTKSADAFDSPEQTTLLFKWAKPESVYDRKSGFWETTLFDVIEDGMFNAGRDLMVLVRGVSNDRMKDLQERWNEGTRVLEF